MKRIFVVLLGLAVVALLIGPGQSLSRKASASNPGTTVKRLLSCPDTDGSGVVLSSDITKVVRQYGIDSPSLNYQFIMDLNADGVIRTTDFTVVVQNYGAICPMVDTQVARATLAILNDPDRALLMACDEATLASRGYLRSSTDVPGQGVHYVKIDLWDGTFDVTAPEGLVCQDPDGNGPAPYKLAAELYVESGDVIGWNGFDPAGGPVSGVNIDAAGFTCPTAPCSWDGPEGWHAHAFLCTAHIGTADAWVLPGYQTAASCQYAHDHTPCTSAGCPGTWTWKDKVGWMGHLWNFQPNQNLLPDVNGTQNGRFADCRPPFKHNTCPM